jgi:hypothetical protein
VFQDTEDGLCAKRQASVHNSHLLLCVYIVITCTVLYYSTSLLFASHKLLINVSAIYQHWRDVPTARWLGKIFIRDWDIPSMAQYSI